MHVTSPPDQTYHCKGWLELCIQTVYDRKCGGFPSNNPYTHRLFRVDSGQSWLLKLMVGQNHKYTVCVRYFWQENHQIYGHIRCIYTVLANPI